MTDKNAIEILLVEDNPDDAELVLRAFGKYHLADKVFVAKDGEEALEIIFCRGNHADRDKNNTPKVIFLDLKLPKVDGLEVLRAIKADLAAKSIPIVVLTSSLEAKDLTRCYELGVNSYLFKPVEYNKFVESVALAGLYWMTFNRTPYKS